MINIIQRGRKEWTIDIILLAAVIVVSSMYFVLNAPQLSLHILRTFLDDQIPRLPIFSIIYLAFLPWFWGVVIYSWFKKRYFRQLAWSVIIVNLIAFAVYLTFQTYVPREAIMSNNFFSGILQFIYNSDQPYNGFPSLHSALSAATATYFVCIKSKRAWIAVAIAVLIVASTLFVKQHFIADAISGVILGVVTTLIIFGLPKKAINYTN